MVTIEEAISQVQEQELGLAESEKKLRFQEQGFLKQTAPKAITLSRQIELGKQVGRTGVVRAVKQIRKAKKKSRLETLPKFRGVEKQIGEARIKIEEQKKKIEAAKIEREKARAIEAERQSLIRDITIAKKVAFSSRPGAIFALSTKRQRELFREFRQDFRAGEKRLAQFRTIKEAGLKLISKGGKIVGFKDIAKGVDLSLSNLKSLSKSQLGILEKGGLIEFKKIQERATPIIPLSQVEVIDRGKISGSILRGFKKTPIDISPLDFVSRETKLKGVVLLGKGLSQEVRVPISKTFGPLQKAVLGNIPDPTIREVKKIAVENIPSTPVFPLFSLGPGASIKSKFPLKFALEFVPETVGGVTIIAAGGVGFRSGIQTVRILTKGIFGIGGAITALDKEAPIETRIAGGIVSLASFGGIPLEFKSRFKTGISNQLKDIEILRSSKIVSEKTATALEEGVKLQRFFKTIPDVPVLKSPLEAIPKGLSIAEQEIFAKVALEGRIFGSQSTRLRGLQDIGGDIDIAFLKNIQEIQEFKFSFESVSGIKLSKKGEAIGIPGEKFFDIKSLKRIEEFPFSEPGVKTPGGGEITLLREQFSRTLSGSIELRKGELRKGGKDIGGAILSARGLIGQEAARIKKIDFPPLKVFKQFKLAIAERRLSKFELALPEFEILVSRKGVSEIAPIEGRFVPSTDFPEILDFLPKDKRGRFNPFAPKRLSTQLLELKRIIKTEPREKIDIDFRFDTKNIKIDFKPSGLSSSRITTSRINGKITSSFFPQSFLGLSKIPISVSPSIFDSKLSRSEIPLITPSIISPIKPSPTPTPTRLTPSPSGLVSPELSTISTPLISLSTPGLTKPPTTTVKKRRQRKRKKKKTKVVKKRKMKKRKIAPSFTSIVAELKGGLPEESPRFGILPSTLRRL